MNPTSIPRSRVLCFSRDRVLGETRRLALQRHYDTVFVSSLEELAPLASGAPFDVIILCHTLSQRERASCLELAQKAWPSAGIVSVASGSQGSQPDCGIVVFGLEGPRALLRSVQQALETSAPGTHPN